MESYSAGVSAAGDAMRSIRNLPPSVVLVYASVHHQLPKVLAGIREVVGQVAIMGATTAGEICGGVHQQSVTVIIIASPHLSVRVAVGKGVSEDWRQSLHKAVANPAISPYVSADASLTSKLKRSGTSLFALILYPGNTRTTTSMGYELLEEFKRICLGRIPIFGGAAADDWQMEGNAVFLGDQVHPDSVLIAIFETRLAFGISIGHGFLPSGQRMSVTSSEGHELITVDHKPAADVLTQHIGVSRDSLDGKHLTLTTGYPFGTPDPMGQYSVNVATYFTPRGGVRMTQPVAASSELTSLEADPNNTELAGREAIRKALIRAGSPSPALIIAHYCALRPRIMGEDMARREIGHMLNIAGQVPLAGFFSFGEDGLADDGVARHNNGAVAILVLGSQLSEPALVAWENERLRRELAEQVGQHLLADVLYQIEEAISVIDTEFRITYVNAAFTAMFGYGLRDVVGRHIGSILPQAEEDATGVQGISHISATISLFRGETHCRNKDGNSVPVRLSISPLKNNDGEVTGYVYAMTDLTESVKSAAALQASEARYRSAFQTSPDAVTLNSLSDGMYLDVNDNFQQITGWDREEVIGKTFLDINVWHDPTELLSLIDKLKDKGKCNSCETQFVKKNKEIFFGSMSASVLTLDGEPCLLSITRDITDRKRSEEALQTSEARFHLLASATFEGIAITEQGRFIDANDQLLNMLGYPREDLISMAVADTIPAEDRERVLENIKKGSESHLEHAMIRKDGSLIQVEAHGQNQKSEGRTFRITALRDITERKTAEEEIKHLAFYDPLTRLPNRRLLTDRLNQAMTVSARSGRGGALLFIDLDDFKTLNDTLGHDKGDLLLEQVAQRLIGCIREGDTVARFGGDEFVVMLEDLSENLKEAANQTKTVGEKILAMFNQTFQLGIHRHHNSSSIGATLFSGHQESVDELLKQADLAMYQAKAAGRNAMRFFDPAMQAVVNARAALEADLRQGLRRNEFVLYYQPQVDSNGRLVGCEGLLRWQHPQRGLVAPNEFITLAEESGLILPLGHWVLETACTQLVAWATRPGLSHLTVAVNVSARQFRHPDFADQVLAIIDHSGAEPAKLKLEITESLLLDDVEDIIAKMSQLKAKGVGFSLDDFGTGYSSLAYLKRLPLDQLKIDQSFVRDVITDPNDAAIARTIVALAQSLGISVIAEGVETEAQRDFLAGEGCHTYQGYLFGRPESGEAFELLLSQV